MPFRGHRRIVVDSCVWIYHLESHTEWGQPAAAVLAAIEAGQCQGILSEVTLIELLVQPLRDGDDDTADEYETLITRFPNMLVAPVNRRVAVRAAALRARHGLRTPDAIILATGIEAGATLAVTNDADWRRVDGIEVATLDEID